jgi:hypothetical protein
MSLKYLFNLGMFCGKVYSFTENAYLIGGCKLIDTGLFVADTGSFVADTVLTYPWCVICLLIIKQKNKWMFLVY